MASLTVVSPYQPGRFFEETLGSLTKLPEVESILIVSQEPVPLMKGRCSLHLGPPLCSHETLRAILDRTETDYLLLLPGTRQVSISPGGLGRLIKSAQT